MVVGDFVSLQSFSPADMGIYVNGKIVILLFSPEGVRREGRTLIIIKTLALTRTSRFQAGEGFAYNLMPSEGVH